MRTLLTTIFFLLLPIILLANIVSDVDSRKPNHKYLKKVHTKPNPNVMVMPFELIGNLIVVKAIVNEKEGNFVIDTGADMMILHSRFFTESYSAMEANSVSINDQTEEIKITHVSLNWNGIKRKNEVAKVLDLGLIEKSKGIDILGFIGYPILKDFEVLFDYQGKTLTLFRLNRKGNRLDKIYLTEAPTHLVELEMAYHFPYITMYNGDEPIHLLLDSGAEMNILSPQAEEKLLKSLVYQNTRHLIGFGQARIPCKEYLVKNFNIQDIELHPMKTLIQNMEGFNEALDISLDGFVGYEFFFQHKTSINFKRKEMRIWESRGEVKKTFEGEAMVSEDF